MKPVQSVTTTPTSGADDQGVRMRRYFTAMGFRLVCGIVAILTTGWVRWSLIAAALVLPYVAVVLANAVGPRSGEGIERVDQQPQALAGDPSPFGGGPSTIQGTVLGATPQDAGAPQDERGPSAEAPGSAA